MERQNALILLGVALSVHFNPPARAGVVPGGPGHTQLPDATSRDVHLEGRVTTLGGEPLHGASVQIDFSRQTTDVHFAEVQFTESRLKPWLPREVAVTVAWEGRTFRNLHRYSDFKLFNVETQEGKRALELTREGSSTSKRD